MGTKSFTGTIKNQTCQSDVAFFLIIGQLKTSLRSEALSLILEERVSPHSLYYKANRTSLARAPHYGAHFAMGMFASFGAFLSSFVKKINPVFLVVTPWKHNFVPCPRFLNLSRQKIVFLFLRAKAVFCKVNTMQISVMIMQQFSTPL